MLRIETHFISQFLTQSGTLFELPKKTVNLKPTYMKKSIEHNEHCAKEILSFIHHFNLRKDKTIHFVAAVLFMMLGHTIAKESEVHIITSNNLLAVYLLSTAIDTALYPTLFSLGFNSFVFNSPKSLYVKGDSDVYGDYAVSIIPITNSPLV